MEVFDNQVAQMTVAFAHRIITVGHCKNFKKCKSLETVTKQVGLNINEEETKYIYFTRQQRRNRIEQNVTVDAYNVESVKYLGAIITSDNGENSQNSK